MREKKEDKIENIYLVKLSKRYLAAANSIITNIKSDYDDSILSVYPLLTSSIEAFALEFRNFENRIKYRRYDHQNQTIDDYESLEKFISISKILNLGKFYPLETLKAYQILMYENYEKYINDFELIWSDLRQIRNSIIHPNLVTYDIKIDKSDEAKRRLFKEENVIFLGIFYSDFPGNKKMNALRNQKLFKKSKLGIDIYTYFSQKKFALYFLKKTDEFISNFTNNINNLLLKKRIEEFLNSKT